jgi:hypothetical protein
MPHLRSPLVLAGAIALGLTATTSARAGGPTDEDRALPCRPTIACTAELVPPGTFEIEAGAIYRHATTGASQKQTPFLLKLTVARWLQLQAGSNGYTVDEGAAPARYFDDLLFTLKFHVLDQTKLRPAIALSAGVSAPTAAQEGYVRTWDALFTAYVTKDLGPVHADLNTGLNLWRLEERPLPQGFVALALSTDLPPPFGVMAEAYAFSSAAPVQTKDGGLLFAVTHAPRKWLIFDLGGDVGFFPATRAYSVFLGLTVIPAVLWR